MNEGFEAGVLARGDMLPGEVKPVKLVVARAFVSCGARACRAATVAAALLVGLCFGSVSVAQQAMTAEELEQFIAEQKEALEQVRENQQLTEEKAAEVAEAQAKQEARRTEAEAEINALCEEQETLKTGSFDDCMAEFGS